ncbi:hypothetical protein J2Z69_002525 [Paenibacillus shirakamiensis]|uniref:Uncharacterized protein n=1 Tax=Paenibacillus shirakamiensis TaxID=1265935 RepID=A0ABS4JIE2_9BACL|nr:hypothetical protein [Paenibacillus shirakamiensis]
MLAFFFAGYAILEWVLVKNKRRRDSILFWCLFILFTSWGMGASFFPWWPQPNQLIMFLFGWFK